MCWFWSSGNTHWSLKIVRLRRNTATSRKTEPSIIGTPDSILNCPWITTESKLCYFKKIRTNMLEHRQFKDAAFEGSCASLRPFITSWTRKRSSLPLWRIKINRRRNLPKSQRAHTICLCSRLLFCSKCTGFTVCFTYSDISLPMCNI